MRTVIDRVVHGALALNLGFMTALVFVSVLFRYVLNRPIAWTEELASLLFAWLTFVGAYVGFRTQSHIRIDTFTMLLPVGFRRSIRGLVHVCVLVLLATFIWQGFSLAVTTWSLEFPALEISRSYLYLSLPIGAVLMALAVLIALRQPAAGSPGEERR
jgi:TRAP-type C4-dicarboxylate transport system permease small subunit